MTRMIAFAALIGIAFAASTSSAFAQSSAPGSTPSKPNKVTSVPPPPPGPDKLTTNTGPKLPGDPRKPRQPGVVDDIAGVPKPAAAVRKYKCYSNCNIFAVMCEDMGGGASTEPDGAVVCTVYD